VQDAMSTARTAIKRIRILAPLQIRVLVQTDTRYCGKRSTFSGGIGGEIATARGDDSGRFPSDADLLARTRQLIVNLIKALIDPDQGA
jgi:hypothetical protein